MPPSKEQIEQFQNAFFAVYRKLGPDLGLPPGISLTGPQTMMLYTILRHQPCQVTKLAQMMEVKPGAITVMIDRLLHQGMVERTYDAKDRRVVLLTLSAHGLEIIEEIRKLRFETISRYLSELEPEEVAALLSTFDKLSSIMT